MTLFPSKSIRQGLLKRLRPGRRQETSIETHSSKKQAIPVRESEYFTFDKDGQLIELDDEMVEQTEREVEAAWRKQFVDGSPDPVTYDYEEGRGE